jgi:hypothetical protein
VPSEILERFPEINTSNYGHDDACALNAWGVELVLAAAANTLTGPCSVAGMTAWRTCASGSLKSFVLRRRTLSHDRPCLPHLDHVRRRSPRARDAGRCGPPAQAGGLGGCACAAGMGWHLRPQRDTPRGGCGKEEDDITDTTNEVVERLAVSTAKFAGLVREEIFERADNAFFQQTYFAQYCSQLARDGEKAAATLRALLAERDAARQDADMSRGALEHAMQEIQALKAERDRLRKAIQAFLDAPAPAGQYQVQGGALVVSLASVAAIEAALKGADDAE